MKTTGRKYKTVKTSEAKGTPECFILSVSTIVYETKSLPDSGAQGFTSLAGQQSLLSPLTPALGLQAHTDTPAFIAVLVVKCRCWGSELVPSCLGNKLLLSHLPSSGLGGGVENKMEKEGREICHTLIFYRVLTLKP